MFCALFVYRHEEWKDTSPYQASRTLTEWEKSADLSGRDVETEAWQAKISMLQA